MKTNYDAIALAFSRFSRSTRHGPDRTINLINVDKISQMRDTSSEIQVKQYDKGERMQTIIQVLPKRTGSLREQIIKDARLENFDLFVTKEKTMDRSKGWSEIKLGKGPGVLKIEWHAPSQTLICRIETKNDPPYVICGAFISFLLAHYSSQIASMHTYTYPTLKRKKVKQ